MMQVPMWLQEVWRRRQQQGVPGAMGQPSFNGEAAMNPRAPMSTGMTPSSSHAAMGGALGGRYGGTPPPNPNGPGAINTGGLLSDQAMQQQFPAGMGAEGGGMGAGGWAGLAGMAGGMLSKQGQSQQAPVQFQQTPATPLGDQLPSLYNLVRMRGY